jgi:hypothetical protein
VREPADQRLLSALRALGDGLEDLGVPWPVIGGVAVIARAYRVRAGRHLCAGRVDLFGDHMRLAAIAVVWSMQLEQHP